MRAGVAILIAFGLSACGSGSSADLDAGTDANGSPDAANQCTGDVRGTSAIYYGTAQPSLVPLTSGQILAIGSLPGCSGTLIAPDWVLTAGHCGIGVGDDFCIGETPSNPNECFEILTVVDHDESDTTLGYLGVDVRERVPAVEPIPIITEALDTSWVGQMAEAAGYGSQEDGGSGEREFAAEPIAAIGDWFTIDGQGNSGACFGDSGGPVMVIASDTTVRVAGDLSWGDPDCLGEDNYARIDLIVDWIESFTGPTLVGDGPFPCGPVNAQGRCFSAGATAMWCDADVLQTASCGDGEACGWDDAANGYRCITGTDPCDGVDEFGACDGNIARWCEAGQPKQRDCASCSEKCTLVAAAGGSSCVTDPCADLDYLGRCNGNVAEWCESGRFNSVDCTDRGETCQYIDDSIGWFCQ